MKDISSFLSAACLAHPLASKQNGCFEKYADPAVAKSLKRNKVLYRSFQNWSNEIASFPNDFIQREYKRSQALKKGILEAIELFNRNGVKAVFLKSSGTLPLDSDNFDLLFNIEQLRQARSLLVGNGFTEVRFYREPNKILYRKTRNGEDFIALHLHTRISWFGVEFVNINSVWNNLQQKEIDGVTLNFVKPEIHVPITLAHAFYENGNLKLSDILYLYDSLYQNPAVSFPLMFESPKKLSWEPAIASLLQLINNAHKNIYGYPILEENKLEKLIHDIVGQRTKSKSEKLAKKISTAPIQYLPIGLPQSERRKYFVLKTLYSPSIPSEALYRMIFLFSRLMSIKGRRHMHLCLMGMDGVGKTAHSQRLIHEFNERGYTINYSWNRQNSLLLRKATTFRTNETSTAITSAASSSASPLEILAQLRQLGKVPIRQIGDLGVLSDYLFGLRLTVKRYPKNFQGTLYDRWSYDTLIDLEHDLPPDSISFRGMHRLVQTVTPKLDLKIVLFCNSESLLKRKPEELTSKLVHEKEILYQSVSSSNGLNVLRTDDDFETVHSKILELALQALYGGRTKGMVFNYNKDLKAVPSWVSRNY